MLQYTQLVVQRRTKKNIEASRIAVGETHYRRLLSEGAIEGEEHERPRQGTVKSSGKIL